MSDSVRRMIAELEGWTKHLANGATPADGKDGFYWMKGGRMQWDHPIPDTLDEAAKLPEGWGGEQVFRMVNAPYRWYAKARRIGQTRWRYGPEDSDGEAELLDPHAWGDTEKEARFALRLAVLEHIAKETP